MPWRVVSLCREIRNEMQFPSSVEVLMRRRGSKVGGEARVLLLGGAGVRLHRGMQLDH